MWMLQTKKAHRAKSVGVQSFSFEKLPPMVKRMGADAENGSTEAWAIATLARSCFSTDEFTEGVPHS